jgi:ATPase subunit of ABC transporter with duplicated ATPase domains
MILMDEPTNHLDAESVAWLQNYLSNFPGCVILVTHDRYFLDQITGWILELDRGKGIPYEGNYSAGWRRRPSASRRKRARKLPARNPWPANSNGSAHPPRPARPSPRPA